MARNRRYGDKPWPNRTPLGSALFGVDTKWLQVRSYFVYSADLTGSEGWNVANYIIADEQHVVGSMERPLWLAGAPNVRVRCPLLGRAERAFTPIILNLNLFE